MKLKDIKNKKITIEDLAVMTKRGFDEIRENFATKDDLKNFATKDDFNDIKDQMLTGFDKILGKLDKMDQVTANS